MRKNEMKKNFNNGFQNTDEALVMLDLESRYDRTEIIAFRRAVFDKIYESDDPETENKNGTRHPSTRAERRKKTAHAKARKVETIRARESRKLPYSHMLGKGKRHDHVWIDERSIVESRTEAKLTSELRDFVLCEESEWEWYEKEQKDALWEYLAYRSEIEDWEKFLSRFHEREKEKYIKAALEAAAKKIKLEAEERFRSQWWI